MKKFIHVLSGFSLLLILSFTLYACAPSEVVSVLPGTSRPHKPTETSDIPVSDFPTETDTAAPFETSLPNVTPAFSETPAPTESSDIPSYETPEPNVTETPVSTETPICEPTGEPTGEPFGTPVPTEKPFIIGDNNTVYLTFDDGPCALTLQLLDILDEYNIKATFFTIGYFVDRHPEIVREAAARGHLIACHTYSHDFNTIYKSVDAFMNDVHQWENAVKKALGALPPKICVRFPGGSHNGYLDKTLRTEIIARLEAEGYCWYDWNFGDNDKWLTGNTENLPMEEYLLKSYKTTLNWVAHGDKPLIFLAHDTSSETLNVIRSIIEDLISKGFGFATLNECPASHLEM